MDGCNSEKAQSELLARVGARVRALRQARSIPRRVLSERSGVSPRYPAQLEAGNGNISIVLLNRVAQALDQSIDALLGNGIVLDEASARIGGLFQSADPDTQAAVSNLLDPVEDGINRAQRICLLGLRGAGKSTLGRLAGEALGLPFMELNREIERLAGMPVGEVMALYGQDGYRTFEAQALNHVIETEGRLILAVAGGIVADPRTYKRLLDRFHTIWLVASPEEHMARVRAQGDERPMTGNPQAMSQLKSLLRDREPDYARALSRLDTSNQSLDRSLKDLLRLIQSHQFLMT